MCTCLPAICASMQTVIVYSGFPSIAVMKELRVRDETERLIPSNVSCAVKKALSLSTAK